MLILNTEKRQDVLKKTGVGNALGDDGEDHPIFFRHFQILPKSRAHPLLISPPISKKSKTASPLPLRKNSKKYQKIQKIRKSLVRGQSTPR